MADDKNTGDLTAEPSIVGKEPAEGAGGPGGGRLAAEPSVVGKEPAEGSDDAGDTTGLTFGGAPAEEEAAPRPAPTIRGKMDRFGVAMGTGRRKTGVARVRVK
ncbi:MAG TPA: hypothetical protein VF170_17120, partial [Planctomycetaceae bacterium]